MPARPAPAPIAPHVLSTLESFAKPAVESGLLSREDLRAALRKLRTAPPDLAVAAPEARLLTAKQAAETLACSRRTIARMTADGTLPAVYLRPGCRKSLRYRAVDVARLTVGG